MSEQRLPPLPAEAWGDEGHARWETWQALSDTLGERSAMELIFVAGVYVLSAMAFETWRLPPAPGVDPLPSP